MVLCNRYKICRCSVSSFYPLLCLNTQNTHHNWVWGMEAQQPSCKGLCPSAIQQGNLTSETLSLISTLDTLIFKGRTTFQFHLGFGCQNHSGTWHGIS